MSRRIDRPPELTREALLEAYSRPGASVLSLSGELGYPRGSVTRWLRELDIPTKGHLETCRQANARTIPKIPPKGELEDLLKTLTVSKVARHYHTTPKTVSEWISAHGLSSLTRSDSLKRGRKKWFEENLPSSDGLAEDYEALGFNKSALRDKRGLTRKQVNTLFERNGIETVIPWRSKAEISLHEKMMEIDPEGEWVAQDRTLLHRMELDVYSPIRKLAIEYCGLYWHSEATQGDGPKSHLRKLLACQEKGVRLLTVFETDDLNKVVSVLASKLGLNERIPARRCEIGIIDNEIRREFENEHHLQNSTNSTIAIGLTREGSLVSCASFSRPRFSKKYDWELVRYTVAGGYTVIGGFGKILKFFVKRYPGQTLLTYADRRFGDGSIYSRHGLKRLEDTSPGYWYWSRKDNTRLFHRVKFQKHKLAGLLENFDPTLTEWENMQNAGYDRIWDCGNAVYVLE